MRPLVSLHFNKIVLERNSVSKPDDKLAFRTTDDPVTVGALGAHHIGKRIIIRSGDLLGTVCGRFLGTEEHVLVHFTTVLLSGSRKMTFRNDMKALVFE